MLANCECLQAGGALLFGLSDCLLKQCGGECPDIQN
jgi:hypothetical protein